MPTAAVKVEPRRVIPVAGSPKVFPVRRVYCIGRNYADHAREMGGNPEREAPFFFMKPADAVLPVSEGVTADLPYPAGTSDFHHEVELVVAIGKGGRDIRAADALEHVWGYAVGLDMTRRDLQGEAKKLGRPWDIGKGFDESAPIGPVRRAAECTITGETRIRLDVNGQQRQASTIGKLIWSLAEVIEHLSKAWELAPGDLIFSGTPEGVAAVVAGDTLKASVEGVGTLQLQIVAD
jgi:fumarylpyruvate hydrolase